MATRVDLPIKAVREAFTTRLASLKRAANTATNDMIKEIMIKEQNELTNALANLTEVK